MTASFWFTLAAAAGASCLSDRLAVPCGPVRRAGSAWALHVLAVCFVVSLFLLVTARPVFSVFAAVVLVAVVALVSNAKYESLREPLVFTDLSLFSQLFSHPRLYLPFLSAGKVAAIVAGVGIGIGGYLAECPAVPRPTIASLAVLIFTFLLTRYLSSQRLPLTLDPGIDQQRHGFFAVFVAYLLNGLRRSTFDAFACAAEQSPFAVGAPVRRPDVVVIQSESFFDARRISPGIEPVLYAHFDRARQGSVCYGEFAVPAWGANTMRTEFAMLTGLPSSQLGYARFYPYAFVRRACASIASWFGRGGYETVAIHPYYADFFGRDRAFPLMGFDRFLDIRHFAAAPRAGPYISDAAVADAVIDTLNAADDKPLFVFAITMENHGPLHLETVLPGESKSRHPLGEADTWKDLTAYLRHIANADVMIGRLLDYLRSRERETVFCFYGDHVPALSEVYQALGVDPVRSDYFIWSNSGVRVACREDAHAESLGSILLAITQAADVDATVGADG